MKPSFLSSTLSLAFILSLASVFILIIIALFVAIYYPEAYNIASSDKLLVMVLIVAYMGFVSNIVGAYLGSRKVTPPEETKEQISSLHENNTV